MGAVSVVATVSIAGPKVGSVEALVPEAGAGAPGSVEDEEDEEVAGSVGV